jgi:hypothetical protein
MEVAMVRTQQVQVTQRDLKRVDDGLQGPRRKRSLREAARRELDRLSPGRRPRGRRAD